MNVTKFLDASGVVRVGRIAGSSVFPIQLGRFETLAEILTTENPIAAVHDLAEDEPISISDVSLLPPIDQQEVWAAGVTYRRSQTARMEESEASASCYDLVYKADRPELFFKATPHRVRGHGQPLRIRSDSQWNVPEPELTLVLSPAMKIVGLTVGNDMSSRDIEGENPLYLPQAKTYDGCAGLGPWITLVDELPLPDSICIGMKIERNNAVIFEEEISAGEMARSFEDLVSWLGREATFPSGAFLMTGTGIIPENDFTLHAGDMVHVSIAGVGTLTNSIVQA